MAPSWWFFGYLRRLGAKFGEQERKLRVVREGHVVSDKVVGDAVCKNKYSSYCANDLDIERDG